MATDRLIPDATEREPRMTNSATTKEPGAPKHTAGPWKVRKGFTYGWEVYPVRKVSFGQPSEVAIVNDTYGLRQGRADARLIAAAPRMLQTLRDLDALGGLGQTAHEMLRAAIAEATGGKA